MAWRECGVAWRECGVAWVQGRVGRLCLPVVGWGIVG